MTDIGKEELEQIEEIEVPVDTLLRVLAGRRTDQRSYALSLFPPLEEKCRVTEVFNDQHEATVYPVIEPDMLVDREGHEPVLVDEVEVLLWDGSGVHAHDVSVTVLRDGYPEDRKAFIQDWEQQV